MYIDILLSATGQIVVLSLLGSAKDKKDLLRLQQIAGLLKHRKNI